MTVVDTAYVQIEPQASDFGAMLGREIGKSLNNIDRAVQDAANDIIRAFERAGSQSGDALGRELGTDIGRALNNLNRAVADETQEITNEFQDLANDANRELSTIGDDVELSKAERAFADLEDSMRRAFDDIDNEANQASEAVGREFQQGGERAERALAEVGDRADREFNRVEREANSAFGSIGRGIRGFAVAAGAALLAIGAGAGLVNAVQSAADLGESINAVNVVLETGAASFLEFGESAATSLGITQAALNEAVTPIAALLKNAGSSGEVLSEQLQTLATRATDVGSVFNQDVNTVLEAFGAALRGETEPIRAFGVQLDAASIAAKAVELGLASSTSEVSNAAKAQAAYALILEQTNVAAGDFAATATSLPNLMKTFRASIEEAGAELGAVLLPAITELTQAALPLITTTISAFTPALQTFGDILGELAGPLTQAATVIGGALNDALVALLPAINPVAQAFADVITAVAPLLVVFAEMLGTILPPLAIVISEIARALTPVIQLFAEFATELLIAFQPILIQIADLLADFATVLGEQILLAMQTILPLLLELVQALLPIIPAVLQILEAFIPLIPVLTQLITTILPPLIELLIAVSPAIVFIAEAVSNLAVIVIGAFIAVLQSFADFVSSFDEGFAAVGDIIGTAADWIRQRIIEIGRFFSDLREDIRTKMTQVREAIETRWEAIVQFFREIPSRITNALASFGILLVSRGTQLMNGLREGVSNGFARVREFIGGIPGRITNAFAAAGTWLLSAGRRLLNGFRDGASQAFGALKTFIGSIPGRITGFFANAGRWLYNAGSRIIGGLIDGIRSQIGSIASAVGDAASRVRDFWPFSPAKTGPLRQYPMERAGSNLITDLASGIRSESSRLESTINEIAGIIPRSADRQVSLVQPPRPVAAQTTELGIGSEERLAALIARLFPGVLRLQIGSEQVLARIVRNGDVQLEGIDPGWSSRG